MNKMPTDRDGRTPMNIVVSRDWAIMEWAAHDSYGNGHRIEIRDNLANISDRAEPLNRLSRDRLIDLRTAINGFLTATGIEP